MPKEIVRVKLNPELLKWARESAGYREEEIARSSGVLASTVGAWESGTQQPTFNQLEAFARKVKRPLAALFLAKPPQDPPLPKDFRQLPASKLGRFTPETLLAFREARNLQFAAVELLEALDESISLNIPHFNLHENAEEIALQARSQLGITMDNQIAWRDEYHALSAWRESLFNKGIFVLQFPIPRDDVRGFSLWGDKIAVITVSTKDQPKARIFSIFHEYCHLCLKEPGVSNSFGQAVVIKPGPKATVEAFCNRFAAAFLLPFSDPQVRMALELLSKKMDHDNNAIIGVSKKFKVSKYVILIRLLALKLIDKEIFDQFFFFYKKRDEDEEKKERDRQKENEGGPDYWKLKLSERGKPFTYLVFEAYDQGQLSLREASQYLSIKPKSFNDARDISLSREAKAVE